MAAHRQGRGVERVGTKAMPVSAMAAESVERPRTWASDRCLSADKPGIYKSSASTLVKPGRKVTRDPSNN